jgi:hypothetical protein
VQLTPGQLSAVKVARSGDKHIHLEHRIQVDQVERSTLADGLAHHFGIGIECITQRLDKGRDVLLLRVGNQVDVHRSPHHPMQGAGKGNADDILHAEGLQCIGHEHGYGDLFGQHQPSSGGCRGP